ncbi:PP2C family protein-serine/threonine phosphatase [Pigmentiphaga litoralis]|uniref:Sigma-B regulation protein RsbU (Phosphoserine phosphatase) n=1 Tax=Pigmentiphaga litoralis TaxID=516702 RepID=A0A7Y9IXW8_9BURK|nr:PP2C family protein-serine/threonine phosphatase [Pigmentiphaga litoralis]NYE25918.1 sigma-B regulation protein RsbU (phosphoserine phosphatase) [Pigmentiphaga litoralis]NYE85038.1 sigma-B regulation protein RsbU (phosphoserine phosphatase) [Pigmentiphaga litoralis]
MLLRSRITLIVALGFGALTVGLGSASLVRDRLLEQRLAQTSIAAQSALWGEIVAVETGALGARAGAIAMNLAFGAALARGDRDDAARALASLGIDVGSADSIDFIAVIGADREPLYTAGKNAGLAVLDASTLDRVLTGQAAAGLRQASATQLPVIAASPLKIGDSPAALVVGRDVQHALRRYASRAGASVTLLTLRGRLAASTDPGLWQRAALSVSPRAALAEQVDFDNRIYSLISVPVRDIADGAVGAIVTLSDATDSLAASRWVGRLAIAGALLLALVGLALVNFYLWRSFRPLQAAIAALQALSRGDATVRLDAGGSDEIGRIAQAVAAFRMNAQELAASRALRERVRRRQESVIRRELHALADATDMTRRDEVLALLDGPASDSVAAAPVTQDRDDDQLRRLARIMGDLTRRIVDQHNSLSTMVIELRDALVSKTRLAGLQQELQIASQVQLSILPRDMPVDPRVNVFCHITPAREVGGDFYDYFPIDANRFGFVIADVSGKGVPAALFMAISRTLLKSTALFVDSPSACLQRLNDLLAAENEQMLFVTVFYAVIDLSTGQVDYVNAGHNPPWLIRRDGDLSPLPRTRGIAVAVHEGFAYQQGKVQLAPGDTLYLYTDGITEAFDVDGQEYGDARLQASLARIAPDTPIDMLSQRVIDDVRTFERGAAQADDMTSLSLRYLGGQAPGVE